MTMGGSNINVGGVNFTIGIDLATFEANLAKAEELAKVRAKRIQQALNVKTVGGSSGSGGTGTSGATGTTQEQIQDIVVRQKRKTISPTESIQLPPAPPTIYLTQEVVVTRHLRVVDKTGLSDQIGDIPVAGSGPAFEPEQKTSNKAYRQSVAKAKMLSAGIPVDPETGEPDLNDPRVQSKLYANRRSQENIMRRVQYARQQTERRLEREANRRFLGIGIAPTQREAERRARVEENPFIRIATREQVGTIDPEQQQLYDNEMIRRRGVREARQAPTQRNTIPAIQSPRVRTIIDQPSHVARMPMVRFPERPGLESYRSARIEAALAALAARQQTVRTEGQNQEDNKAYQAARNNLFLARQQYRGAQLREANQVPPLTYAALTTAGASPTVTGAPAPPTAPVTRATPRRTPPTALGPARAAVDPGLLAAFRQAASANQRNAAMSVAAAALAQGDTPERVLSALKVMGFKDSEIASVKAVVGQHAPAAAAGAGGAGGGVGGGGGKGIAGGTGRRGSSTNPFSREFSGPGVVRIAAGFLGLNLGINIAAGAARDLHQALVQVVESAIQLEQSGRGIGVAFGSSGRAFTGTGASAFAANPLTKGTTAEYQQLVSSLAPVAAQFGLSNEQINQVATISGHLARIWGVDLKQAGEIVKSVLHGNLEAGQALDLELTDQYGIIKNVGLTWQQLVAAQGPAAATATVLAQVQIDVNRQLKNNTQNADETIQAFDRLGKAFDNARNAAAKFAAGPVGGVANKAADVLENPSGAGNDLAQLIGKGLAVGTATGPLAPAVVTALIAKAILDQREADKQRAESDRQFAIQSRPGPAPKDSSITELSTPGYIKRQFQLDRDSAAIAAQNAGQLSNEQLGIQTQQNQIPLGPGRTEAGQGAAENARLASLKAAVAQARIDEITAKSSERQLSVQASVNKLLLQRITLQDEIAPKLIEEQSLQNRLADITRENFDLTKNKLIAQQSALGPTRALAGFEFTRAQANARIGLALSQSVAGQEPTFDIGEQLMIGLRATPLFNPEAAQAGLSNVEEQRKVQLAGFAIEEDITQKQIQAIPVRKQLQQLTLDELNAAKLSIAVVDAQISAVDRWLAAQALAAPIQERLIAAEQALAEARVAGANAAEVQANLAANTPPAANGTGGGIGSVNITINLDNFKFPSTGSFQDQLDLLAQAAKAGTLAAIADAAGTTSPRVDPNVAAGR